MGFAVKGFLSMGMHGELLTLGDGKRSPWLAAVLRPRFLHVNTSTLTGRPKGYLSDS